MSEEQVDTAPEKTTEETAPTEETSSTEQSQSFKGWLSENAPEGASTKWLEKYDSDEGVAKAIYSAQSMIGKKGDIPSEDASDETRTDFWNKLGADKIEPAAVPEFGEEFGDLGKELTGYYGGITEKVSEIAKEVAPTAKSVPDLMNKVVGKFIEEDAENARKQQVEQQGQMKEQFEKTAKKAGLSTNELQEQIKEVQNKYGWAEDTPFAEVLLTLAKETTNSNTLQDAQVNNTSEGLEQQLNDANGILMDMANKGVEGPEYSKQLEKVQALIKKTVDLKENS